MKRCVPFSLTEYFPPAMKSFPSNTHTAGAPRGDHGAEASRQVVPSLVTSNDGAKVELRLAAISQS